MPLDEAWHELRLEKEKVKGATLRIRQQEEEIKNMSKVGGAFVLWFTAAHRLAAKLGCHVPPEAILVLPWKENKEMHKGTLSQGSESPCPPPPHPLPCSSLHRSMRKGNEPCRMHVG